MVKPRRRQEAPAHVVARPTPRLIGFIGRATVTDFEASCLRYIGRCIAQLGHRLIIVPAAGATHAVREGVEVQGGEVREIEAGVLDVADRTLLYPDPTLLARLERAYKDLHEKENIAIISEDDLPGWVTALKIVCNDYGIEQP